MHVIVLIAGIADAKRPLQMPASGNWVDLAGNATTPFKLSPFDEAALEIGLKLRDKYSGVCLTAIVTDGAKDLQLMRTVASYRIDKIMGLHPPSAQRGCPIWLSKQIQSLLQGAEKPVDLVLMGREHGDMDDGLLPPYLSEACGWPFVCQALNVEVIKPGTLSFRRSATYCDELITLAAPACASISNDKSNRLRHPLMKNVMLAKQQNFEMISYSKLELDVTIQPIKATQSTTSQRGHDPCRILAGTMMEQAEALAAHLRSCQVS